MNHIYKVIWSKVKNSYIVVSEIAGTVKKSGRVRSSKPALAAVLAAFLLTGISVSPASAAIDGVTKFVEPGDQNIKIGNDIDLRNNSTENAVLAVGGGNKTDYAYRSQLIGVGNTLEGTAAQKAAYNLLNGYRNTVTKAEHVSVIGSENTVENSKSQTVIGDSNKITGRNAGTVSGKQEERTKNVSDLVIGKGNKIEGNDTYMKGYESLTVIGNNNEMVNPGAGIVIGDNQKVGASKESVVIGSMTPEEKADSDIGQKHASVVVGYHAQSGTRDGGGMNVALGHGAKAYGWQETVTGIKSIVEAGDSGFDGYLASVYGGLNTVASSNTEDQYDGMANTVVGTLNKTEGANGALVFGAGNSVTHSFGTAPTDENGNSMNEHWGEAILFGGQGYAGGDGMFSHDEIRKAMGLAMSTGGGSVVTMGNGNTSDYAIHSQIIGSGNILTGTANTPGINNTINGYANIGRNVERVSMMGTGNNMSGSTADVVIGDYHHMDGGKNNVILGSMATEKKAVEKTYTMKDASGNVILEQKYKVMENVPIKSHTANISNAVMLGYNTDVEKDGGVALGADSIASVDKGVAGYDPSTKAASTDTSATWQATAAAVSVGKAATPTEAAVTRQITNVAAGSEDTDAVNVAQLKAVKAAADAAKVHFFSVKGNSSDENYNNDGATGDRALAVGVAAKAGGLKATALTGGNASGTFSFAVGNNAQAKGWGSVAIGVGTLAEKQGTVAIGYGAKAYSLESVALGYNTQAGAPSGKPGAGNSAQTAMGSGTIATGGAATAFGLGSVASGAHAIAGGDNAKATGQDSVALGKDTKASGTWSVALGRDTKAKGDHSTALGYDTKAEGQWSTALGIDTTASGSASTAMGSTTQATGTGSTAMGGSTTAAGNWSLASGGWSNAKGDYSTAMGYYSMANAWNSFAVSGGIVEAAAENSIAMGKGAKASVSDAVALGSGSVASTEKGKIGYDISGADHSNDTTGVWKSTENAVSVGDASKGITRQITGVAAGREDTDAVNVAQLKKVEAKAAEVEKKHTTVKAGDYATVTESTNGDGGKEYTISGPKMESTDGTVKITDKVENGKKVGYNLSVDTSSLGIEKTEVTAGENVTVTSQKDGNKTTYTINAKDTVVTGGTASYAADGKGTATLTNNDGSKAEITGLRDLYTSSASLDGNTLNFTRNDGSTYSVSGIASSQDIKNVTNKVGELGTRVNRVGAGAAALAALHPLDFDPDDKWDVAAGYGNYKDAHAVAVGAFYRPNEDTMLSVGGSFGGGENMVNAGVSVKVGQGNNVSTSKVAMAREIKELRAIVEKQNGQIQKLEELVLGHSTSGLQENTRGEFPDLPKNHWAYEYVRALADRGLINGYPDGEFKGGRQMTRYEFAAVIYRALQNGAVVDGQMTRAVAEFAPELEKVKLAEYFRIDTVMADGKGNPKIQRVRVSVNN